MLETDNKLYVQTVNYSDGQQANVVTTGVEKAIGIFKVYHSYDPGGACPGLLVLKEDGNLYIIRKPETEDYSLEKLEYKNIVASYEPSVVVDILGNQYEIK